MGKSYDDAYELLETMSANNYQWPSERLTQRKVAGIHELDAVTALSAQVAALTRKIDNLGEKSVQSRAAVCDICAGEHPSNQCAIRTESVQYVNNYNQQQNNNVPTHYYPGVRNHPNFSWSNNQGQSSAPKQPYSPGFQNYQQPQQQAPPPPEKKSNLEELLTRYISQNETRINSQEVSIRNLENQVGQLAQAINNRPQGTLPSDTEVNPKREGKEHCKAVTLRSGRILPDNNEETTTVSTTPIEDEVVVEEENAKKGEKDKVAEEVKTPDPVAKKTIPIVQPMPFPQRMQKQKLDQQFSKFVEVLKRLHINIPFAEALEQMPSYMKFMKDILSKKRKLGDYETVALTQECSAIIQKKLPPKLKDPGSFTIPCSIGSHFNGKALCDLGASINLMPLSIYKKLGLNEAKPTSVTLQLADRSLTYPKGVVEDVLVKVDRFIFPADFIVLDCEEDLEVPIILGRPFLATGRTIIDVQKGQLTMRVQDQEITFNVFEAIKFPSDGEDCFRIDRVDKVVKELSDSAPRFAKCKRRFKQLDDKGKTLTYEESFILKSNQLPKRLRYESYILPDINSATLTDEQPRSTLRRSIE